MVPGSVVLLVFLFVFWELWQFHWSPVYRALLKAVWWMELGHGKEEEGRSHCTGRAGSAVPLPLAIRCVRAWYVFGKINGIRQEKKHFWALYMWTIFFKLLFMISIMLMEVILKKILWLWLNRQSHGPGCRIFRSPFFLLAACHIHLSMLAPSGTLI